MNDWLYTDIVKKHFENPRSVLFGDESQWPNDERGIAGNLQCGDQMLILPRITEEKISDIRWKTYGCASAIASTSILSEAVKGMTLGDAYRIRLNYIVKKLRELSSHKIHCSVLGDKTVICGKIFADELVVCLYYRIYKLSYFWLKIRNHHDL